MTAMEIDLAFFDGDSLLIQGTIECRPALMVGVHDSDDWESVNLANIHTLGFRCRVLDEGAA